MLVKLHWEKSVSAACAAGLFKKPLGFRMYKSSVTECAFCPFVLVLNIKAERQC